MNHLKHYNEEFNLKSIFKKDIHEICEKYEIKNYTINSDRSIDVDGGVVLYNKKLTKLPLKFRNVSGGFWCHNNQLTSLRGCPISIGGDFYCSGNKLTSFERCLEHIGGDFYCNFNQITSLEGCPKSVGGDFWCNNNQITSFEGCPRHVGGGFSCVYNPVNQVWKLFNNYSKLEFFNDCDIIRNGKVIILDRLNYFLEEIGKNPVIEVEGYKCI